MPGRAATGAARDAIRAGVSFLAADRELGILFDRIVLEVFVTAVPIGEVAGHGAQRFDKDAAKPEEAVSSVTGDPEGAGYCHYASCRSWSAGPVNAFTLWKPEAVKVTQGEDQIGEYHKNERSYRQWCKVCGGHLLTRHPTWDLVDVYAATIPTFPFTPGIHVNYASTVLPMNDDLPKLKDFPTELGGSGEPIAD